MKALGVVCVCVLSVLVACGEADQGPPSDAECERLRTHLIDLRLQEVTSEAAQHRQALEQAIGASFVAACTRTIDRAQWECAMAASASSALAACNVSGE